MTPELIAILALGVPLIGLLLTFRRDARSDYQALRADNQALRAEVHAGDQRLREDFHAEISNLRTDVQALAERTARLEGVIQGLVATHHDRDRRDAA